MVDLKDVPHARRSEEVGRKGSYIEFYIELYIGPLYTGALYIGLLCIEAYICTAPIYRALYMERYIYT